MSALACREATHYQVAMAPLQVPLETPLTQLPAAERPPHIKVRSPGVDRINGPCWDVLLRSSLPLANALAYHIAGAAHALRIEVVWVATNFTGHKPEKRCK